MYIKFPKVLKGMVNYKLSSDAKLLYLYMYDRMLMSQKNKKSDDGGVYIYYSQQSIANDLGVTVVTARRALSALTASGLVHIADDIVNGKPRKLYVKDLLTKEEPPKDTPDNRNDDWETELLLSMQ